MVSNDLPLNDFIASKGLEINQIRQSIISAVLEVSRKHKQCVMAYFYFNIHVHVNYIHVYDYPTHLFSHGFTNPFATERCKSKKGASVSEILALFNCSSGG